MDRGGTITWYLNANSVDFSATLLKARAEAKAAGADIDKSLNNGSAGARSALKELGNDSNRLSGNLRNVRKETVTLSSDSDRLRGALGNLAINQSRLNVTSALGARAMRGFGMQLGGTERQAKQASAGFRGFSLSLDDFNRSLGRSASTFRNFQIALRGFELTAMIVAATTAAGAILSLASAVAALSGLLFTIPAGIGVAASAISTLKVATLGVGDAFKELIKPVKGATAAQSLAKRQSDITAQAMKRQSDIIAQSRKRDANLVERLTELNKDYAETLRELADERMRKLNEQILRGVEAWGKIGRAAANYLDISEGLNNLNLEVAQAQAALTSAVVNYGAASQQATEASRNLFAAQGKLSQANADLDENFGDIRDNVKDLATNLNSLRKANRNQMKATLANLKALRLDKKARGESTTEADRMIDVLEQLGNIKDANLGANLNLGAAQAQLNELKGVYPDIAVAAQEAATDTEKSLTKSLANIADSMRDVRKERAELATELQQSLADSAEQMRKSIADAAEQSAMSQQGKDPFEGLSRNARLFVIALKEVYDAFQPIKNDIQDKFFAGLDTEVRNVAAVTFPILKTGLGEIAVAMNGMAKEASRVVQQPFFTGALENSMRTTAESTNILTRAVEPLARVFTDLMNIGNPFVIMLSKWTVKQAEAAAAFTGSEEGQRRLTGAIRLGIKAMKEIFGLFKEVGGLLYDVFKLGTESGFSMIGTLTDMVKSMREWMATEDGAAKMTALFEAADTVLRAFGGNMGEVLKALLGIVEAYNELDGPAKDLITQMIAWGIVLTPIITYLSSIWASGRLVFGVLKEGVQVVGAVSSAIQAAPAFMESFKLGMDGMMVASEGAAGWFGKAGNKVGELRDAFGNGVGKVKEFGTTIANVAKDTAVKGAQIAKDGAKAAAGWIVDSAKIVAGWAASFAGMIARGVVAVATMVAQAVATAAAWVAAAVATAAAWVVANAAMLGLWGVIILAIIGAVALIIANWDGIKAFFIGVFEGIKNAVAGAINWVKENWPLLLAILTGPIGIAVYTIAQNWETIKNAFRSAWEFIKGVWSGVAGWFGGIGRGIVNVFYGLKNGIVHAFNNAVNWIRGVPGSVIGIFRGLGNMLGDAGWSLIMGFWHGISRAIWNVRSWISGALRTIRDLFPFSPAKEGPFSGSGYTENSGEALMRDFGMGIISMGSTVLNQTESIVSKVADTFSGLASDVGAMQTDFGLNANAQMAADISGMAPPVMDSREGTAELSAGTPVVINQNNEVHTDLDMDQVNRNLAWEMNKL